MTRIGKGRTIIIAILVVALISAFIGVVLVNNNSDVNPKDIRNERLTELELRDGEYDENSIVLNNTSKAEATALADELGAKLRITSDGSFATLTLSDGRTIKDIYNDDAYLKYISSFQTDWQASITKFHNDDGNRVPVSPNDSKGDEKERQKYLDYLNLSTIWNKTMGSGITVAVIDTGIDYDHKEFSGRISEYSYNASEDKIVKDYTLADGSYDWSLVEDVVGHGTSVAGAIAASMDGNGMVGVAPEVTLLVIKAECNQFGAFTRTSDLVFGLYYAIERDVSVVNMSFGGYGTNPYSAATKLAYDSDIICVAAAGNGGTATLCYPAADQYVIGVGALSDDSWELASYSNYGENVDIVAPGTVYTTANDGGYDTINGTSFASPLVAGSIALLLSQDPYITFDRVKELLIASSYDLGDLGHDYYYGYGAIDVSALVLEQRGTITYDMMTNELDDTEGLFIVGHTLQEVLEPERIYAIFDGWYYDPYYTEEYVWYEDAIYSNITVYAKWVNEEDGIPFTYVELDDGTMEIRSYTGRRRYIAVPEYINGKPVTSIGDFAFDGERNLREVDLPFGLTHIGLYAFRNCSNLLDISIPCGVTEIEEGAFYSDIRMSAIIYEGTPSIKKLGASVFAYCSKLTEIEIPASVKSIGTGAFLGTLSLKNINVQKGNTNYASINGVLFNSTKSTLIAYPSALKSSYTIPDETSIIDAYAFAYTNINDIDLNNTSLIGTYSFMYSSLTSVGIVDSVNTLGKGVFCGSAYLSNVTFGENIQLASISDEAFTACGNLKSITIPEVITDIGNYTFSNSGLREVIFGKNSELQSIGNYAFCSTPLASIKLPKSLIVIGGSSFSDCLSLSNVIFEENSNLRAIGSYAFANSYSLTEISLPNSLAQLGDFAFLDSALVGDIKLSSNLTYLGAGAFASCHNLENIIVNDENIAYQSIDGVVYTKDRKRIIAYPAGNSRTTYAILDGTETVSAAAIYGSSNLLHVTLPDDVVYIEEYAFAYMSSLRSMEITKNVMQVGRYAFLHDMAMCDLTFSENSVLPRISYGSFAYSGITSVIIPKSVSTMAQGAFIGCSLLSSVTFEKDSKLESISAYMFDGASNLQSITFESGSALTSVQAHGLEGMSKLTSIDFGDAKLENIDNFALRFCESLTSLVIPNGTTNIGRYAFYGCSNLNSVTIPESIEHIGSYAFLQTSGNLELYFAADTLPYYLDEDWDRGIKGYYLGVTNVVTGGDYRYASLISGGIAILEYSGIASDIDFNSLDLGGNIVTIGGSAFAYSTINNVILPDSLITIQRNAFYYSSLNSISIPSKVEFIGTQAFADTPITSLDFSSANNLKVIEQSAFEGTKKLNSSVTIPSSVTNLGRAIFRNSSVSEVTIDGATTITEIPIEMFYGSKIQSFIIPDGVTKICDGAFELTSNLESISYGENLTWLGTRAFYKSGLKSFTISKNLTVIEEFALVALDNLTSFTVDNDNPYYKTENGLLLSKNGKKLVVVPAGKSGTLTIPQSVEIIGFGAFEASSLEEVLFNPSSNILSIGYRAFFGAEHLTEITIPSSVISIDYYAFAYAKRLKKVLFAEGSRLKGIYEGAFYGCIALNQIVVPSGIVEISDFAFYGCTKLTSLPISKTSNVKGIYSYSFAYTGIKDLVIPDSVIDIDSHAFLGASLVNVTIPDTNAKELIIGIGAFEDCNNLEEITLPFIGASFENTDITWFGYIFGAGGYQANATYVPESLKVVIINSELTAIGSYAFYELEHINEIVVPDTVTDIYYYAFYGTTATYDLVNEVKLYDFSNYMQTVIYGYDFGVGIRTLNLANGVTELTLGANHLNGLETIYLPSTITYLGSSFVDSLKDIYIKDVSSWLNVSCESEEWSRYNKTNFASLHFIDDNGNELRDVVIPDSVTHIPNYSFAFCNLDSITVPNTVISIAEYAFDLINHKPQKRHFVGGVEYSYTALGTIKIILNDGNVSFVEENGVIYDISKTQIIYISNYVTEIIIPATVTSFRFKGNKTIQKVSFEEGTSVKSIDRLAFSGCSSLKRVVLPNSLESIGESAFEGCSSLSNIIIPKGVTSIGGFAFSHCNSLTSVTIPDSVTLIGESPFFECHNLCVVYNNSGVYFEGERFSIIVDTPDGFRFKYEYNTYKLVAYLGEEEFVTLPNDIYGESYTIYRMVGAENVIIPNTFDTIDDDAFYSLYSVSPLKSITIPEGVISIGNRAFYGCSALTSIIIPDSITTIGNKAFYNCTSLNGIRIGNGLSLIGDYAFSNCNALISIADDNKSFVANNGVIYDKNKTKIIYISDYVEEVVIPATVTSLSFYKNKTIQKISFEDGSSITNIDRFMFSECTNLKSIAIPASVTSFDDNAFTDCVGLDAVYYGGTIDEWVELSFGRGDSNPLGYARNLFIGNELVTNITINYATHISSGVFSGYEALVSATICNGVTSIGESAFFGCSGLTSVTMPDSLTSIDYATFGYCSALTSIRIPDKVTNIGEWAFIGCTSLEHVAISNGVSTIGASAFGHCSSLTSIFIPNSVTSIGFSAFSDCKNAHIYISKDTLFNNLTSNMFSNGTINNETQKVHIMNEDGIEIIDLIIDNTVLVIPEGSFLGCSSLQSLTIPASVKSIEAWAFYGCSNLYKICNNSEIGLNIASSDNGYVAYYAKMIIDKEGNKTYKDGSDGFTYIDTKDDFRFMLEGGSYKLISYLGNNDNVTLPEAINGNTYEIYKMRCVKNVIIPSSLTSIDDYSFCDCTSLLSITIPDSITSIEAYAFHGCINLTTVSFGDNSQLATIGESVFSNCSSLLNITVPNSVTKIAESAFVNTAYYNEPNNWVDGALYIGNHLIKVNPSVRVFVVREGTVTIHDDAFEKCYSLRHLTIGGNHSGVLTKNNLTNLVTLVVTEMPTNHYVYEYFGYSASDIPITLTNVVLAEGVYMRDKAFDGISNVTIYVSDSEKDVRWDDNYTNWSNGNKVVYGDDWINVDFYNPDGTINSSEIFLTDQVIRIPTIKLEDAVDHYYVADGWDIDGDGVVDSFPATSSVDISATLIVSEVTRQYDVIYFDSDNSTVLHSEKLDYGTKLVPIVPEKRGYTFVGWGGFIEGMTVNSDISFVAQWSHNGKGHSYGEPIWVDATCTVGGYYMFICTVCGDWYASDYTEPNGHTYIKTTIDPTCDEGGYDLYTCHCGYSYKDNYVDKLGHSFGEWVIDSEASCTVDGIKHRDCSCGYSESELIDSLGHEYTSAIEKGATCTSEGKMVYTCHCGDTVTESIPMKEHCFEKIYADESWIQQLIRFVLNLFFGYDDGKPYYFKCSECGHIAISNEVTLYYSSSSSAMSVCTHEPGKWMVVSEVTSTTSEIERRVCSKCGEIIEYRETHGHDYGAWINEVPATCTEEGTFGHYHCSDCDRDFDSYKNELSSLVISALGHSYGEWYVVDDATCTETGTKRHDCENCDYYETETIPAAGHSYTSVVTSPTCTERGYITHTCSCGDSYIDTYVQAKGHLGSQSVKENEKHATCDVNGSYDSVSYCLICGEELSREKIAIHALGHTPGDWIEGIKSDCTHAGERYKQCTVCGMITDQQEIEPTGHSYTSAITKEPTSTENGEMTYTCHCGDTYTEAIDKLPPEIVDKKAISWTQKSNSAIEFSLNAAIEDFIAVQVNGSTLEPSYYVVKEEDGVIVELKADYLETLDVGEYEVSIIASTGTANTSFSVTANNISLPSYVIYGAAGVIALLVISLLCVVIAAKHRKKASSK